MSTTTPPTTNNRLSKLRVPPGWRDVTISSDPNSKVLATGYDTKGRKQYIYNDNWIERSKREKFEKMSTFKDRRLTKIVRQYMNRHDLSKECVVANMIKLMKDLNIRVGNTNYLKENNSVGLTTLMKKHLDGNTLSFIGKSGVHHTKTITSRDSMKFIRRVIKIPGRFLFYYNSSVRQGSGMNTEIKKITPNHINGFLKRYVQDDITSKDIRTHTANKIFKNYMSRLPDSISTHEERRKIAKAVRHTAQKLGNSSNVCKGSYIAPENVRIK